MHQEDFRTLSVVRPTSTISEIERNEAGFVYPPMTSPSEGSKRLAHRRRDQKNSHLDGLPPRVESLARSRQPQPPFCWHEAGTAPYASKKLAWPDARSCQSRDPTSRPA